jgi:uncharacterized membrane protein
MSRVLAGRTWHAIASKSNGYIQNVDTDGLMDYARSQDAVLCMQRGIGDFAIAGAPLIWLAAYKATDAKVDQVLNSLFVIDRHRTIEQDAAFGVRQIVDIALKALSPGVNDSTTAVTSIDYLTVIMTRLASRRLPSPYRYDGEQLRVIAVAPSFHGLWALAFNQIRRSANDKPAVLWRLLRAFDVTAGQTQNSGRRRVLRRHLAVYDEYIRSIEPEADRVRLEDALRRASAALKDGVEHQDPAPISIENAA